MESQKLQFNYISRRALAQAFGVSQTSIRRYEKETPGLPVHPINGKPHYKIAEVIPFREQRDRRMGGRMSRARKNPRLRQQPGANSKSHFLPKETLSGRSTRVADAQRAAKLYRRAAKRIAHERILEPDDIEGRALRALRTHRWLDEPDKKRKAQLRGGGSSWPKVINDWDSYGWEDDKEPRPYLSPALVTDYEIIFGYIDDPKYKNIEDPDFKKRRDWFIGLSETDREILWLKGACDFTFQMIGDKFGRSKQWACDRRYKPAMRAVLYNVFRGDFEMRKCRWIPQDVVRTKQEPY